jgi:uncharacterized protein
MALNIWRITDGKAGHDSQSIGLCNAIGKLKECEVFNIPANSLFDNCKNLLLKQFPRGNHLPDPTLIIGAGHGTHLPLLCAKRARQGKTIVLMKPSLPLSLFDFCIIPTHDSPAKRENVIVTSGALSPVQFNENKLVNTGLILLGGPSKHYQWNDELIINQIKQIVANNADTHWTIADSPRTPSDALARVFGLDYENINILKFAETNSDALRECIFTSEKIWVSADSISMIYESISSGAAIGLLDVKQKTQSRVSNAVSALIDEKQLTTFTMWNNTHKLIKSSFKFNEADRCASLLLEQGLLT